MDSSHLHTPLILIAAFVFFVGRRLRFRSARNQLPALLARGGVLVDVRSESEFASGARAGSVNIPLDQLQDRASMLDPAKPVILCCASGARSGMAAAILKRKGFQSVVNAGSWKNT